MKEKKNKANMNRSNTYGNTESQQVEEPSKDIQEQTSNVSIGNNSTVNTDDQGEQSPIKEKDSAEPNVDDLQTKERKENNDAEQAEAVEMTGENKNN